MSSQYQKVKSCSNSDVELSGEYYVFDFKVIFILHEVVCLDFVSFFALI